MLVASSGSGASSGKTRLEAMSSRRLEMCARSWPVIGIATSEPAAAQRSARPTSVADASSETWTAGIDAIQRADDEAVDEEHEERRSARGHPGPRSPSWRRVHARRPLTGRP